MAAKGTDVLLKNIATSSSPVPKGVYSTFQKHLTVAKPCPPPPPSASESSSEEEDTMATVNDMRFSSSPSESGDEPVSEIQITEVYLDPLDPCMEMIEELATVILKTGRLKITGEPGDMGKLMPAVFGLQSTDKELPCLLLQLLQAPFFLQADQDAYPTWESGHSGCSPDDFLSLAHLRLGFPVDTAIYHLLRGHCCKGARQAEELIKTTQGTSYNSYFDNLSTPQTCVPQMPPIIFPSALGQRAVIRPLAPVVTNLEPVKVNGHVQSSSGSMDLLRRPTRTLDKSPSNSSVSTAEPQSSRGSSVASLLSNCNTSSSSLTQVEMSIPEEPLTSSQTESVEGPQGATVERTQPLPPKKQGVGRARASRQRRTGEAYHPFDQRSSSTSDVSGDEGIFSGSERLSGRGWHPERNTWHTTIVDNSVIVGAYGDNTYPLLMWNPRLKVEFKLSSSVGLISPMVTGIDPSKPTVAMKVVNSSSQQVAFSIRVYRQSSMIKYHVAYPHEGLHILEQHSTWEDNAEFYARVPDKSEYFVIDLFVCTLRNGHPSWNVQRKYVAMGKPTKSHNGAHRRPRPSTYQPPGNMHQKEDNLKIVLSHGLQCVVKNKVEEAETILTQALYLPDFQRLSLKAFLYICLAVLANKRRKAGQLSTMLPLLMHETNATRLVHVCEAPPGIVKMPRTMQLVKQLKKELNVPEIMKKLHHRRGARNIKMEDKSKEEDEQVGSLGGTLSINCTLVTIPPGALPTNTRVKLRKPDTQQFHLALCSAGWEKTVSVVTVLHIECNPSVEDFRKPVEIACTLTEEPKKGPFSLVRLQHSNYLRQWKDITDDINSKVSISGREVQVTTDRVGWIAVAMIQLDASMITQMAMGVLSREPITLKLSVYGQVFGDGSIQIAVFVVPCKPNEEAIHKETEKPPNHTLIAFPHTLQAWPGERLRLELCGRFEPDITAGEQDLYHEFEVQDSYNHILEKWVKSTSGTSTPLTGKLLVSSQVSGKWQKTAEMNLSNRNAS